MGDDYVKFGFANKSQYISKDGQYISCGRCGVGLILPLFPLELCWNKYVRASLYFLGLAYCFFGIAIVADIFMSAIEKITSKTKKNFVKVEINGRIEYKEFEDKVWNETVANLTLMALGSSAPEILLSCIEIIGNTYETGKLGAGTIVGSAAFNLLVIIGVCIVAVPKGEVRRIKVLRVFIVTSLFSLFAYFWMIVVLEVITPDEVDVWEALVTLFCFPILVVMSWWADHQFCIKGKPARRMSNLSGVEEAGGIVEDTSGMEAEDSLYKDGLVNQEALIALYKHLREINPDLTEEETASLVATKLIKDHTHSRLWYRTGISRELMGGPHLHPILNEKLKQVYETLSTNLELRIIPAHIEDSNFSKAVIEFQSASFAVMENIGTFNVVLMRHGRLDIEVRVKVETFDGTATAGLDYKPFSTVVTFPPNISEKEIPVTIVDDVQWEPEEEFFIRATILDPQDMAMLGKVPIMEITILDDDKPGVISFVQKGAMVKQNCDHVVLQLKRKSGCDGVVTVSFSTIDGTALAPTDYISREGIITFGHGEITSELRIPIVNSEDPTKNINFFVSIYDPTGGARLGDITKAKVSISNEEMFQHTIDKMLKIASDNMEAMSEGHENYSAQFKAALSVSGGATDEASRTDNFLHVVSFGWKLLFACIPPVKYCDGWLCFVVSLFVIGLLTAVVGDLAEAFGCLIGMKDTVTAITFVALGTSLPDLFASKSAVAAEKYADNAVGNVTGSNSVNVFLGLGLPWAMASIYHQAFRHDPFVVCAGDLAFSVGVYFCTAFVALTILFLRRNFGEGELGGTGKSKWTSGLIFFLLWIIYVAISALRSYGVVNIVVGEESIHQETARRCHVAA